MGLENSSVALGQLADPASFNEPLDTGSIPRETLEQYMRTLLRIRFAERRLADGRRDGQVGGPVHLGVGQEAVAVGVSSVLRCTDRVFGGHRSHAHLLALGSSLHGLFAEVLGRNTGLSRGMGGSMHLWDQPRGFYGSVPIVAGTVPLAVGAAMAAKMQKSGDVAVAYFGDGAIEEGVVHESMNLARVTGAPVLFVVENNFFASHMHIALRQPIDSTARFAKANDIPYRVVDGNDVIAVAAAARELVDGARRGEGPVFLEAVTFRWYGHVDWREDIDVGVHRSVEELDAWRRRDPVKRLEEGMVAAGIWSAEHTVTISEAIEREVSTAWDEALADPHPRPEALLDRVYAASVS
jgi:TPP-dependent pyruvate/acetoin dehydrogenase alpha subunit